MFSYMTLPHKKQKSIVDEEKVIQVHSSIKLINERERYTKNKEKPTYMANSVIKGGY